jgi:hypothetical protein
LKPVSCSDGDKARGSDAASWTGIWWASKEGTNVRRVDDEVDGQGKGFDGVDTAPRFGSEDVKERAAAEPLLRRCSGEVCRS